MRAQGEAHDLRRGPPGRGSSTATVSRALNGTGQIATATRAAIDDAVAQLGYHPNTAARSLVTRSTQTIALLLPDITNPFYAALVSGIQERALEAGHTMLLCTTEGDPEREEPVPEPAPREAGRRGARRRARTSARPDHAIRARWAADRLPRPGHRLDAGATRPGRQPGSARAWRPSTCSRSATVRTRTSRACPSWGSAKSGSRATATRTGGPACRSTRSCWPSGPSRRRRLRSCPLAARDARIHPRCSRRTTSLPSAC